MIYFKKRDVLARCCRQDVQSGQVVAQMWHFFMVLRSVVPLKVKEMAYTWFHLSCDFKSTSSSMSKLKTERLPHLTPLLVQPGCSNFWAMKGCRTLCRDESRSCSKSLFLLQHCEFCPKRKHQKMTEVYGWIYFELFECNGFFLCGLKTVAVDSTIGRIYDLSEEN